jgi:O-antigen ligase
MRSEREYVYKPALRRNKPDRPSLATVLPLFLLLAGLVFDQATETRIRTRFWGTVEISVFVQIVRTLAPYIVLLSLALIATFVVRHFKLSTALGVPLVLVATYAIASLRTAFSNEGIATNYALSLIVIAVVIIYISSLSKSKNQKHLETVYTSLFYLSVFFAAINVANIALGGGFAAGNSRLYGSSAHPNFMGAQTALLLIVAIMPRASSQTFHTILRITLAAILAALLAWTGSRTGILMFLSGLTVMIMVRSKNYYQLAATVMTAACIFLAGAALILTTDLLPLDTWLVSFERTGSGDTRSEAWGALWTVINEYPIWGLGEFIWASENSLAKGWAAFGILYAAGFTMVLVFTVFSLFSQARRYREIGNLSVFAGLAVALAVGSTLEGFLVENVSFTTVTWAIVVTIAGLPKVQFQKAHGQFQETPSFAGGMNATGRSE